MTPHERLDTARLYLVVDARPLEWLRAALRGGVDLIQLRDRSLDDAGLIDAAVAFRTAADEAGALFILNDRPDLVEACRADGVHVGQDDATPAGARRAVGPEPHRRPLDARAGARRHRAGRPRRRLPRRRPGARDADEARPPRRRPRTMSPTPRARSRSRGSRSAASTRATSTRCWIGERRGSWWCERSPPPTTPRRPPEPWSSALARHARKRRPGAPASEPPRPGARRETNGREAMARGYAKARERDDALRAALEPIKPGEKPWPIVASVILAVIVAVANVILVLAGWDGDKRPGAPPERSSRRADALAAAGHVEGEVLGGARLRGAARVSFTF